MASDRRQILKLLGFSSAAFAFRNGLWTPQVHAQTPSATGKSGGPPRPVSVEKLTYTQSAGYSRIVIECSGEAELAMQELPADPEHQKSDRVLVDIKPARRGKALPAEFKIENGILLGVRTGQFDRDTVRVVLDFRTLNRVGMTRMFDPFRVVLDIDGRNMEDLLAGPASHEPPADMDGEGLSALLGGSGKAISPAATGSARPPRIILDPGHGGKDPGAVGPAGLQEKEVALRVADETGELLTRAGYRINLTRENDRFLELTERTAFANKQGGDLFVSIHCNAAKNREARGIETYYLNPKVDKSRALLIAKENFTSLDAVQRTGNSFADAILSDLAFSMKEGESRSLSEQLLETLWDKASGFPGTQNRGLGHGPLYVLIGARMPSSLVELSFISNPAEEKLLRSTTYQKALAEGLASGIRGYMDANPVKGG
ncbi:MAG: N-acetylmuramoyl-L-alanine amidase [Deltaproteobacteria bacterium]|nr:N-acetylmuramoyl-L-alanine amidase [Deltaproteobacteria bacterium]